MRREPTLMWQIPSSSRIRIFDAVEYVDVLVLTRALVRHRTVTDRHEFQRIVDGDVCVVQMQGLGGRFSIGAAGHGTVIHLVRSPRPEHLELGAIHLRRKCISRKRAEHNRTHSNERRNVPSVLQHPYIRACMRLIFLACGGGADPPESRAWGHPDPTDPW